MTKQFKKNASFWRRMALLFLVFLLLFMLPTFLKAQKSHTDFADVEKALLKHADQELMQKGNEQMIRRLYDLPQDSYQKAALYYPVDNMGVSEFFLVQLASSDQLNAVQDAMKNRLATQLRNFDGYGAEQVALLDAHILLHKKDFVLFCICESPSQIQKSFQEIV